MHPGPVEAPPDGFRTQQLKTFMPKAVHRDEGSARSALKRRRGYQGVRLRTVVDLRYWRTFTGPRSFDQRFERDRRLEPKKSAKVLSSIAGHRRVVARGETGALLRDAGQSHTAPPT